MVYVRLSNFSIFDLGPPNLINFGWGITFSSEKIKELLSLKSFDAHSEDK